MIFYIDGHVRMDTSPEYQMGQVPSVQEFSRDYWYQAFTEAHPLDDLREIVGGTMLMTHIRYQLRHAITHLAEAFSHDAFVAYPKGGPQDAFQLYAADFMVDQSFEVHYLRTVEEPVLDGTYFLFLRVLLRFGGKLEEHYLSSLECLKSCHSFMSPFLAPTLSSRILLLLQRTTIFN